MAEAPVCHVNSDQEIGQPQARVLPVIPVAKDLPSAIKAIKALTQTVNLLSGQQPNYYGGNYSSGMPFGDRNVISRGSQPAPAQGQGGSGSRNQSRNNPDRPKQQPTPPKEQDKKPGQSRWTETNRKTVTVKVYNKKDKTMWVEIDRIEMLEMTDLTTKEKWVWTRQK
jgi:hypothetical protein